MFDFSEMVIRFFWRLVMGEVKLLKEEKVELVHLMPSLLLLIPVRKSICRDN